MNPTDPREEKKPKVFLVTMRARKHDGATETVSFRSGIFACESEAHAKVAMLEGREPEFSIDELDAKPFDTNFLTEPLESTISKLAAEIAEYAELKRLIASCHFDTSDPVAVVRSIIEGNMKDRAELDRAELDRAELDRAELDRLRQAIVAKGGDEHSPTEWAYEQACKSLHSKHAELEAARKEREAVEKLKEMAHSAAVTWQQRAETYHEAVQRTEGERDTALAAKDAASQRLKRFGGNVVLNHDCVSIQIGNRSMDIYEDGGVCVLISEEKDTIYECEEGYRGIRQAATVMVESINKDLAALTPAPTQEPPAGGVTISNESSSTEGRATKLVSKPLKGASQPDESLTGSQPEAEVASAGSLSQHCERIADHGPHSENQASPTLTSSNSPADVPSVGRGEWMPIETAPKDGTYILLLGDSGYLTTPWRVNVGAWKPGFRDAWVDHANDRITDGGTEPTHWLPLDAFMLPTEGSGA